MHSHLSALAATVLLSTAFLLPNSAEAFCGFYVSGADTSLYNNATSVVMLRDGTRTVLSMQNNYQGPPEDFALVIPVPIVLQKENVKTLGEGLFSKIDRLAAPRLVEYWESDPCAPEPEYAPGGIRYMESGEVVETKSVTIEAQFEVGEYDVVVLGAKESTALDTWLHQNKYKIPEGAEPYLRPYVQSGQYFFVAKVNSKRVTFKDGQAMLSPLRFHYDSEEFSLPIRLGLINAKDTQDLLVHILARGQRYETANYKNVTIPTNIELEESAKDRFGEFYVTLLDQTLERNPGAVITEYAWDASTCDPCPGPTLSGEDMLTLGADVVTGQPQSGYVLTRLHARYTPDNLGEDLVFKAAPPIAGGRQMFLSDKGEPTGSKDGKLEHGSVASRVNNFQGRYIIWHPFEGSISCENPSWGGWSTAKGGGDGTPNTATNTAFVPRGQITLAASVRSPIPELEVIPKRGSARDKSAKGGTPAEAGANKSTPVGEDNIAEDRRCSVSGVAGSSSLLPIFLGTMGVFLRRRRR